MLAYSLTVPAFDPEAKPEDGDTSGGWSKSTQIHLVAAGGGAPRMLTAGSESAEAPVFSSDGASIAFLRKIDGKTRIHVMPLAFGEASVLDTGEFEPSDFAFSPDGDRIAFLAALPESEGEKAARWKRGGAIHWDREWRPTRLWVMPAGGGEPAEVVGAPGHVVAFRWSPDGTRFAVLASISSDPYEATNRRRPAIVPLRPAGSPRWLEEEPANVEHLAWSPDGRTVAYARGVATLSLLNHLAVVEADGPGRWNAAARLDPTIIGFVWEPDGKSLIAHVVDRTASRLVRLAGDGSSAEDLGFDERAIVGSLTADRAGKRLAFLSSTPRQSASPTLFDRVTGKVSVPVDVNPEVASWTHGATEVVSWRSSEGPTIEGVLTVSPLAEGGKPVPLLVLPHGGPDSVSVLAFDSRAVFFAARGYSVLRPNYRGGIGYGRAFYAANRGRLGEIEFVDTEAGVDALVASGRADPSRLYYGGWSWGGYLTAWTIGHTSRYRAAVAGAAVVDTVTQFVLSDINHGVAAEWEFLGNPWRAWDHFDRANPMRSLEKAKTPTLVIHGQEDDRVSFTQGQILYRALADVGCEVEFLAYPREPHGFTEPAHVVHMLDAWAEWYGRH
jgi:dipeptidyl aminopeptidase/acylaminoacyl peptidase